MTTVQMPVCTVVILAAIKYLKQVIIYIHYTIHTTQ